MARATTGGSSTSGYVAIAVACLFALQALFFACALHSVDIDRFDGQEGAQSLAYCASDQKNGGGKGPLSSHHRHADHCVLCTVTPLPARIATVDGGALDDAPFSPAPRPAQLDDAPTMPVGWASSWSSRAPPRFS